MPALRRRVAAAACFCAVLALVFSSGCRVPSLLNQKLKPAQGGVVTEALVGSPSTLNPLFAQEDNARDIDALIYQGLVTIDSHQQPAPLLASRWELSADHLSYTFTLRRGVRWADGQPFTLDDVLFTFSIVQNAAYDQPLGAFWRPVTVTGVGPDQVRFTLKAPSASFVSALQLGILPHHAFSGSSPDAIAADPHSSALAFGTGPFRVDSLSNDHRLVTLKRNRFASPAAHLDSFRFQSFPTLTDAADAFSTGMVDAVGGLQPTQLAGIERRPNSRLLKARTYSVASVLLNVTSASTDPLASQSVRQALAEGVNRSQIVQDVLKGEAEVDLGPIPPSDWAYSGKAARRRYNPADAEQLLESAGWSLTPGSAFRIQSGRTLSLTLVAVDSYPYSQVADALRAQLAKIGVDTKLEKVPAAVLVERYLLGRHYQMLLAAFDTGPDPDEYTLWHSDPQNATLSFDKLPNQALIDKDLEDGRTATVRSERYGIYSDFQALMSDAAPAIFLYEPTYIYAVSGRLQGVRMNSSVEPADRFQYVTDWFLPAGAQAV